MERASLGSVFDSRANGLNLVRLLLAGTVIIWHSFPLSGHDIAWPPLRHFVGEIGVDGFFAISGYLIVASWMRKPTWRRYLSARVTRILPAFMVCLATTAFVIAPLVSGDLGSSNLTYVLKNAALWVFQPDIDGGPTGIPFEGVWNGSIWTLAWEFFCYLGVMALGVAGLLRWRATLSVLFAIAWCGAIVTQAGIVENNYVVLGSRFGFMFLAGALMWQYRDQIPVRPRFVICAVGVLLVSLLIPNYRLVGALPVAYLAIVAGASIRSPRVKLDNDISYGVYIYAFPVQQVLAIWGAYHLGVVVYAVLAVVGTLPLAILSWFIVEKPAMRLNRLVEARRLGPQPSP